MFTNNILSGLIKYIISLLIICVVAVSNIALAEQVCSDLDGDGIAETCIEFDRNDKTQLPRDAHFPDQSPPEVPEPGEGVPVDQNPNSSNSQ